MTEREVTQLIKLLKKFRDSKEHNDIGVVPRDGRLCSVINFVIQWAKWHGRDELNMDLLDPSKGVPTTCDTFAHGGYSWEENGGALLLEFQKEIYEPTTADSNGVSS